MVDLLTFVSENSQLILLVISVVLALVARYFQTQAKALTDCVQAVTDLSQTVLDSVKDGMISGEELTSIVAKVTDAKNKIDILIKIFGEPASTTEKLASLVVGFRKDEIAGVQSMIVAKK